MAEPVFDADTLRAELALAKDQALELANDLALEVATSSHRTPRAFRLASEFEMKRVEIRRLHTALKVEVSG